MARNARRFALIAAAAGVVASTAKLIADRHLEQLGELVDNAYEQGHRAGWYERGEELDPADRAELDELQADELGAELGPAADLPASGLDKVRAAVRAARGGEPAPQARGYA